MKIISKNTFKFIEAKLHNYKQIQAEIAEWKQEVTASGGGQKEHIPNAGYISDPTANKVMRLENPPQHIREAMGWVEVIDKTVLFAKRQKSYNIYVIWYEKGHSQSPYNRRMTVTYAYTRLGMPERTFKAKRWNIVNYAGVKALEKGLIKKLYENF